MSNWIRVFCAFLLSFIVCAVVTPLVIKAVKRLKAGQPILEYVEKHAAKNGTPTMGGIGFIISTTFATLCLLDYNSGVAIYQAAIFFAYGFIGFLDDFIKVKYKRNQGLKAYQKIIAQFGVALIVSLFCFNNINIGSEINIPFTNLYVDLKLWYIPFCIFVFLATTNSVNLTDGLDGLAGKTTAVYMAGLVIIVLISAFSGGDLNGDMIELALFSAALVGGVLAFLWFNSNPASTFMGDTGSMALGAAVCTVPLFMKKPLLIILMGTVFILSSISVIMQVIYYKRSGKRIFLMAPFHHHLELKGIKECKIVSYYTIATAVLMVLGVLSTVCQYLK